MEMLDALAASFDHCTGVIAGVTADQLDNPTPCSEWDLRTLATHLTGVVVNCGLGASGADVSDTPIILEADLVAQFKAAAGSTLSAWQACAPDATVDIGAGPMPMTAALSVNLLDTTTHSWDIARATGQDPTIPVELAETVLAVCQGFVTDEIRTFAGFAPAITVPDGSSPTDQLVAYLGRQP